MKSFISRHFSFNEADSVKRSYGLDVFRAIAILLVLFCHSMILLPEIPYDKLIYYWTGFLGVELFFVLSGYLIGNILLNLFIDTDTDSSFFSRIKGFWIRRWFRTMPNYYLFLVVNVLFLVFSEPSILIHNWTYFFFGQNLFWPMANLMPESWSLTIEEWFYFSFPLILFMFARAFRQSRRIFLFASLFYIALFVILRIMAASNWGFTNWDMHLRKIVTLRLDAIAYGAIIMVLMKIWPSVMYRLRYILFGIGLIGLTISLLRMNQVLTDGLSPLLSANHFTLTSISSSFLLPFAVYRTQSSKRSKLRSIIAGISIISYSMYLLHYSVVIRLIEQWIGQWKWYYQYLLYWLFCVVLSFLVYTLFERKMTALREKYAKRS